MANRFLNRFMHGPSGAEAAPLGGTRAEALQRLQVGLSGIAVMILLVALADVIQNRAAESDASSVPEAAATVAADAPEAPKNDPLAEAGIVPDLPAEPSPAPSQLPPILPEQGTGQGNPGESE